MKGKMRAQSHTGRTATRKGKDKERGKQANERKSESPEGQAKESKCLLFLEEVSELRLKGGWVSDMRWGVALCESACRAGTKGKASK